MIRGEHPPIVVNGFTIEMFGKRLQLGTGKAHGLMFIVERFEIEMFGKRLQLGT